MSAVIEGKAVVPVAASTPLVVDLAALLAPIPGDNPAGESVQYSGIYDEIREARRADDTLTKGDWEHEPKVAEWPKVVDLSTSALTSKTKDLQGYAARVSSEEWAPNEKRRRVRLLIPSMGGID